jgi:hypothetical protein
MPGGRSPQVTGPRRLLEPTRCHVGCPKPGRTTVHAAVLSWTWPIIGGRWMLIYRQTRRKITRGARGVTASRTARPLDERRGGDPDASIRIAQGGQLAARDERADAGDRQPQPTGRLGQGECGAPADPHHWSHCARNGPRGPGPMHEHLHEQARPGRVPALAHAMRSAGIRRAVRRSGRIVGGVVVGGSADRGSGGCGDCAGRGCASGRVLAGRTPSRPPGRRGLFRRSTASS